MKKFYTLFKCFILANIIYIFITYTHKEPIIIQNKIYRSKNHYSLFEKNFLKSILITIKTTHKNHNTRLKYIASTWYHFAKSQIYAVTDIFDNETNKLYGNIEKNLLL